MRDSLATLTTEGWALERRVTAAQVGDAEAFLAVVDDGQVSDAYATSIGLVTGCLAFFLRQPGRNLRDLKQESVALSA